MSKKSEMSPEYLINLQSLHKETLDERHRGFSSQIFFELEIDEPSKIGLRSILNEMKKENPKMNYQEIFNDYESEYYFPLLLNYLAIIEVNMIRDLMTAHCKLLTMSRVNELFEFISKYKKAIFNQFRWSRGEITSKERVIEDWINNYSRKHTSRQKPEKETKFFNLTENQILKYTNELLKKNIIKHAQKEVFIQYLKNDFTQVLKLRANKTQVVNMFLVLNDPHTRKTGDLKELASKLAKNLYAYVNGKYCKIQYPYLYVLLTDIAKAPKNPILSR